MSEERLSEAAVTFGDNLRKLRKANGLSQEKLAEHLGVSTKHIGDIEAGRSFTTAALLDSVASYFSVSLDELFLTESRKQLVETEADRMALGMLQENTDEFKRKYGIELRLKDENIK